APDASSVRLVDTLALGVALAPDASAALSAVGARDVAALVEAEGGCAASSPMGRSGIAVLDAGAGVWPEPNKAASVPPVPPTTMANQVATRALIS
ncbi:MAG: hypothetical protein ABIQ16_22685, partial [Polyangiaceae bacterium]